ncbi:MAG: AMP-binding protein, partial [Desulfomonilia bacterium]|nr:AMP-binding protein [Desulfomonilia bacterium]
EVFVVGVPDRKYGEQLLAVVILKQDMEASAEELVEFCTGKIARHKIPKYWEFVDHVPMTASGKVQKYKIVEEYALAYAS